MKLKLLKTTAVIALLSISAASFAANKQSVILKTGSFSLSSANQTIFSPVVFDTSSSGVFAIEYEARLKKNTSWGIEFISYQNDFNSGVNSATGTHVIGNFKQYFDAGKYVKPFIGAGFSAARVSLSGSPYSGSTGGFGFQAMGGVKFPFAKKVFAVVEYKIISASPEDSNGTSVDIGGNGLFAGVGFKF